MIDAICREAELRSNYLNGDIVETIYFGGGTPSLLNRVELVSILEKLHSLLSINNDAEITLEANPDDINERQLLAWKETGINRLSIGVQSFFESDLQWMNRAHNATQALKSIELARRSGFENITIDLIYGTPHLTDKNWLRNLEMALQLEVPHLSCYALTVEQNTALQKMIALNRKENIDAGKQSAQFEILMQWAEEHNYEHYEISNFARPGFRSKHNSSYWQGKPYLGLGPSAHSFNGSSRQWNVSNNPLYIQSIGSYIVPFEIEELTASQKLNEYIMTALRTNEGIKTERLKELAEDKIVSSILQDAQKFIGQHLMERKDDSLVLTKKGKLFADGIASDLFRI